MCKKASGPIAMNSYSVCPNMLRLQNTQPKRICFCLDLTVNFLFGLEKMKNLTGNYSWIISLGTAMFIKVFRHSNSCYASE